MDVGPINNNTRPLYQRMLRKRVNEQRAAAVGSATKRPRLDPTPSAPPLAQCPSPTAPRSTSHSRVKPSQKHPKNRLGGRPTTVGGASGGPRHGAVRPPVPQGGGASVSPHPRSPPLHSPVLQPLPPPPHPVSPTPSPHNKRHIPSTPPSPRAPPSPIAPPSPRTPPSPRAPPQPHLSPSPGSGVVATITNWIGGRVKRIIDQIQEVASPRPPIGRVQQVQHTPPSPGRGGRHRSWDSVSIDEVDFTENGTSPEPSGVYLQMGSQNSGRRLAASPHSSSSSSASSSSSFSPSSHPSDRYDWELLPSDVEICKKPDGQLWVLGRGGCGEVYKGLKDKVDDVAVKVIRLHGCVGDSRTAIAQFKQEIDMISKLRHRHIVQFYGACIQPSCLFMVTELMDTDLFTALRQGSLYTWAGTHGKEVLAGIASGLHHLHSRRPPIVHRDIKSPNILVMNGLAKIADVGIAHHMAASDMTAQKGFTMAWAAPEVILRKRATEKIDIWSFGVILWEVVTGSMPHPGHLVFPAWAPAHLRNLFGRCTSDSPNNRPSAAELTKVLKNS